MDIFAQYGNGQSYENSEQLEVATQEKAGKEGIGREATEKESGHRQARVCDMVVGGEGEEGGGEVEERRRRRRVEGREEEKSAGEKKARERDVREVGEGMIEWRKEPL